MGGRVKPGHDEFCNNAIQKKAVLTGTPGENPPWSKSYAAGRKKAVGPTTSTFASTATVRATTFSENRAGARELAP
jgi:hypothetical protein